VDPANAPTLIAEAQAVARAHGLRVTEGKKVVELRPPVDINKGTASVAFAGRVGALREGGSLLFAGDDRTDEDAFRALRERQPDAVTIRIGGGGRQDAQIDTEAEFALASPDALRDVLRWLAARRATRAPG
jgi:trehalose-phosphatase